MWRPSEPGSVLGIDFGGTKVAVTTVGVTDIREQEFDPGDTPAAVLALAEQLAGDVGAQAPRVVSVSTPGVLVGGHALHSPNVPGWDEVDLRGWVAATWPKAKAVLSNDVESAARAEVADGRLAGVDVGLYVNLGTGIAAATVIDGVVVHGASGMAGEIGYGRVGAADGIDWERSHASLELLAGGAGFRAAGIRIPERGGATWLAGEDGRDAKVALDELARHLLTCVLLLNPRLVVIGGGLSKVSTVVDHLRARLASGALAPVEVVRSRFGSHASLLGTLVIDNYEKDEQP